MKILKKIFTAIAKYPMSEPSKLEIGLYALVLLGILWLAKHPIS